MSNVRSKYIFLLIIILNAICGVNAKCYAIKTKFDSYSSFRVLADAHLEKLLEPSIWPAGVLIRDFV